MISANEPFLGGFLRTVMLETAAEGVGDFVGTADLAGLPTDDGLVTSERAFGTVFALGLADSGVLACFAPS